MRETRFYGRQWEVVTVTDLNDGCSNYQVTGPILGDGSIIRWRISNARCLISDPLNVTSYFYTVLFKRRPMFVFCTKVRSLAIGVNKEQAYVNLLTFLFRFQPPQTKSLLLTLPKKNNEQATTFRLIRSAQTNQAPHKRPKRRNSRRQTSCIRPSVRPPRRVRNANPPTVPHTSAYWPYSSSVQGPIYNASEAQRVPTRQRTNTDLWAMYMLSSDLQNL